MAVVSPAVATTGTGGRPMAGLVREGPDAPAGWDWSAWTAGPDLLVAVNGPFDPGWERSLLTEARAAGRELLSIRVTGREVLIGPLWSPSATAGCACCAWVRQQ